MEDLSPMEIMGLCVLAVALIAALNIVGPRLGVAPQIILVVAGAALSYLPGTQLFALNPEFVLMGLLPVLLYAASLALPTVEFRRDMTAIGGLSIVLVIVTATALGWLVHILIPGVPLPIGVALGALLSPTDAAAIGIIKKLGLSPRVVTILDGESLLNDASALVLLRAGLAAVATGFSFWGVAKSFLFAIAAAAGIGFLAGRLGLAVRHRIASPAIATVVGFLVPFCAYWPADLVHASGLVAVVAAGITTRQAGPHRLSATQRMTETVNWHTIEFLAEGLVFLAMGAQVKSLLQSLWDGGETLRTALLIASLAWVVTLVIRAGFLSLIIAWVSHLTSRKQARRDAGRRRLRGLTSPQAFIPAGQVLNHSPADQFASDAAARARQYVEAHPEAFTGRFESLHRFIGRYSADVDYLVCEPLRAREGVLLTWAGLRGVVTVAGAQTLPVDLPHRPLIVLIAFAVAAGSLLVQGLSLSSVAKRLRLVDANSTPAQETARLRAELDQAARTALREPHLTRPTGQPYDPALVEQVASRLATGSLDDSSDDAIQDQVCDLRLTVIAAQRAALLKLRSLGTYPSATIQAALAQLDAYEISLTLRRGDPDD